MVPNLGVYFPLLFMAKQWCMFLFLGFAQSLECVFCVTKLCDSTICDWEKDAQSLRFGAA